MAHRARLRPLCRDDAPTPPEGTPPARVQAWRGRGRTARRSWLQLVWRDRDFRCREGWPRSVVDRARRRNPLAPPSATPPFATILPALSCADGAISPRSFRLFVPTIAVCCAREAYR